MAIAKRKKTKTTGKRKSSPVAAAPRRAKPRKPSPKPAPSPRTAHRAEPSRGDVSPVTGLPIREKVHLPIKGYGRYNSFQVLEQLYGKSTAELKEILAYEERHQARRMVTDRITDMLRRAGVK